MKPIKITLIVWGIFISAFIFSKTDREITATIILLFIGLIIALIVRFNKYGGFKDKGNKTIIYNLIGLILLIGLSFIMFNTESFKQSSEDKRAAELQAKLQAEKDGISVHEITSYKVSDKKYEVKGKGYTKDEFKYAQKYVESQVKGDDPTISTMKGLWPSNVKEVEFKYIVDINSRTAVLDSIKSK